MDALGQRERERIVRRSGLVSVSVMVADKDKEGAVTVKDSAGSVHLTYELQTFMTRTYALTYIVKKIFSLLLHSFLSPAVTWTQSYLL